MTELAPGRDLLTQLAESYGIATDYWAFNGDLTQVADSTIIKVLAGMGVDAKTELSAREALRDAELRPWREVLPECTVVPQGSEVAIPVHLSHGAKVRVELTYEDGRTTTLSQVEDFTPPRDVDGQLTGQASFKIPNDLPLGYHRLTCSVELPIDLAPEVTDAPLIVVPNRLPSPGEKGGDGWGVMAQLYSVCSKNSWGIGDTSDLKELCSLVGAEGGDFLLINPLHAAEPVGHMTPSPYLPVTRRFFNPIYIRPEDIREVAYMPSSQRALVEWAGEEPKKAAVTPGTIERDSAWEAKRQALELIFNEPRSAARQRDFERFRVAEGSGLENFAFWCALREKYGEDFPEALRSPATPQASAERAALSERIDFYAWMQWVIDDQLAEAQRSALSSGMHIGIFHDLAVGVHACGSDTWSLPEAFADGVTVGAPPDMYNQLGQNWSQPPWRPDSLRRLAYAPLRDMARTVLRHAGAVRVDHVMGLFRLWWIPEGNGASDGAYVRFDHDAMLGVLMLEAQRADAVVVGEDLGNVEPWVRDYLNARGILGTSVLWFEQNQDGQFKRPEEFRTQSLVTVDTHDLPPLAGYLAGEHVDLRDRLHLLTEPVEEVRTDALAERGRMVDRLREFGLLSDIPTEREIIEAMHCYIARTPAQLLAISLTDAVGERKAQNVPGTDQEYENWRVPLTDSSENLVLVEDLAKNPRLNSLLQRFKKELSASRS
ncbi:MAG: 4-alpha-glucanotransferase [Ancrocorticia populi]|uniref:4-alpha-glucanotransferase n=1 Tax=Ancrocorticia populi TaxID=2175228 RepID=UPI003F8DEBE0